MLDRLELQPRELGATRALRERPVTYWLGIPSTVIQTQVTVEILLPAIRIDDRRTRWQRCRRTCQRMKYPVTGIQRCLSNADIERSA